MYDNLNPLAPAGASVPLMNTNKIKDIINCDGHERDARASLYLKKK
jgi:hypothetical protein